MKLNILHPARERKGDSPNFAGQPSGLDPEHTAFLREFGRVRLRAIHPEDEERMIDFHKMLSDEDVYLGYFEPLGLGSRTVHEGLAQACVNSADSHTILAELHATASRPARVLAVGRLATTEFPHQAAFASLMGSAVRNTEVPRELLLRLMDVARAYRFHTLAGEFLSADQRSLKICRDLGFKLHAVPEDDLIRVHLSL
ncbi:MAG TPA: hypothetical protein VGC39_00780 [Candidatus Methylacidiphilales bacterium]